jgi:hypothetical protein
MSDRQAQEYQDFLDFLEEHPNDSPPARLYSEDLSQNLRLDNSFRLGNWGIMSRYCDQYPEDLATYVNTRAGATKTGLTPPATYTHADVAARALAVTQAYGGCTALRDARDEFVALKNHLDQP